jgi:hypothetical protein
LLLWPSHLETVSWLALGCLAILDLKHAKSTRGVALLGLATGASLLAGDPQHAVFLFYAWGSLLVALLLGGRARPGRWLSTAGLFAAGLFIGALTNLFNQMLPGMNEIITMVVHLLISAGVILLAGKLFSGVSVKGFKGALIAAVVIAVVGFGLALLLAVILGGAAAVGGG